MERTVSAIKYTHRTVKDHLPARIVCTDVVDDQGCTTCALVLAKGGLNEGAMWLRSDLSFCDGDGMPFLEPIPTTTKRLVAFTDYGVYEGTKLDETRGAFPDSVIVEFTLENGVPVSMEVMKP